MKPTGSLILLLAAALISVGSSALRAGPLPTPVAGSGGPSLGDQAVLPPVWQKTKLQVLVRVHGVDAADVPIKGFMTLAGGVTYSVIGGDAEGTLVEVTADPCRTAYIGFGEPNMVKGYFGGKSIALNWTQLNVVDVDVVKIVGWVSASPTPSLLSTPMSSPSTP